jgi:GNAT superfamily N-acetyltransferase
MSSPIVRQAQISEVSALANTLQAAFVGYPWTDWVFPVDSRTERVRNSFALYLTASINGLGEVWTTDDHSCVAAWLAPGPKTLSHDEERELQEHADMFLGDNSVSVAAANHAVDAHHPSQPYWFLATVGTRPERRGLGLTPAVLQPVLRRCDHDGLQAVLDTSTLSNVRLYSRLGFETTAELQPGGGAPPVWVMARTPK